MAINGLQSLLVERSGTLAHLRPWSPNFLSGRDQKSGYEGTDAEPGLGRSYPAQKMQTMWREGACCVLSKRARSWCGRKDWAEVVFDRTGSSRFMRIHWAFVLCANSSSRLVRPHIGKFVSYLLAVVGEAAYFRSDLFDQRRQLMDTWEAFVAAAAADVVTLRASAKSCW